VAQEIRPASETILRLRQVEARTGLGKSQIYRGIREKTFPKAIPIGKRAVGWILSDIEAWIARMIEAGRLASPRGAAVKRLKRKV
jgi:prophage regulatory protein